MIHQPALRVRNDANTPGASMGLNATMTTEPNVKNASVLSPAMGLNVQLGLLVRLSQRLPEEKRCTWPYAKMIPRREFVQRSIVMSTLTVKRSVTQTETVLVSRSVVTTVAASLVCSHLKTPP